MKKRSLATIFVLATVAASGAFAKGGFQDPQRIIMAEKICHELEFVYQYPDPNFMLTTEE